jgi:hypothetical protein
LELLGYQQDEPGAANSKTPWRVIEAARIRPTRVRGVTSTKARQR